MEKKATKTVRLGQVAPFTFSLFDFFLSEIVQCLAVRLVTQLTVLFSTFFEFIQMSKKLIFKELLFFCPDMSDFLVKRNALRP